MAKNTTAFCFRDALRHQLANYEDKKAKIRRGEVLRRIAKRLIKVALKKGDPNSMAAIKEIVDRLDGKPTQAITGPEGDPITIVQRVIVQHTSNEIDITPQPESVKAISVKIKH